MFSFILWEGLSPVTETHIVAILTKGSSNAKTGSMDQLWILSAETPPHQAVKSGEDRAVCGDCKHRPSLGGACYVKTFQAPLAIYKKYKKGGYPKLRPQDWEMVGGYAVRLGAYGDPAMLPLELLQKIVSKYVKHTGYTHQWQTMPEVGENCMASTDSLAEYHKAKSMGLRSFRVTSDYKTRQPNEIICPNDTHGIPCIACGLCDGSHPTKKDILIAVHGAKKSRFKEEIPASCG